MYFFGAPVSPEKLKDYTEHHAMCVAAAADSTILTLALAEHAPAHPCAGPITSRTPVSPHTRTATAIACARSALSPRGLSFFADAGQNTKMCSPPPPRERPRRLRSSAHPTPPRATQPRHAQQPDHQVRRRPPPPVRLRCSPAHVCALAGRRSRGKLRSPCPSSTSRARSSSGMRSASTSASCALQSTRPAALEPTLTPSSVARRRQRVPYEGVSRMQTSLRRRHVSLRASNPPRRSLADRARPFVLRSAIASSGVDWAS